VSTFYESPESGVGGADELEAFFLAIQGTVPLGVQWSIPSSGDLMESTTGDLVGTWSDPGTGGTVTSNGPAGFTNGVGTRIVWGTSGLFGGRRVRGSTFIVPLTVGAYEGAGNITSTVMGTLQTAANALVGTATPWVVWSRPTPTLTGEVNEITSASVPDRVSWLRTRRT
jgi:hypothetical protein